MNFGDLLVIRHFGAVIFLDIDNNVCLDISKKQLLLFLADEGKRGYKVISSLGVGNISPAYVVPTQLYTKMYDVAR